MSEPTTPPAAAPIDIHLDIHLEHVGRVNFAMLQSGFPLVSQLNLTNQGQDPLHNLSLTLSIENAEAQPWSARIERLDPASTHTLEPTAFRLLPSKLAARTEAERSSLLITITADNAAPLSRSFPIDLLAFDQWPGSSIYPELLAAFITPNHPNVATFLTDARTALARISGRDALDGYQSTSRQRAVHIAEACFNSIHTRRFGYINPPASFEDQGQRVRLVDRICRENLGSCLDFSLLLASLWEQTGLNPLVILVEGHAFPAFWTHEAHLPEPAIDDPARIRNLIELGEIVPVESTLLSQEGTTFTAAAVDAKRRMANPGSTFCAIDITASRKRGVRPLPLRTDGNSSAVDLTSLDAPATPSAALDKVALADRAANPPSAPAAAESNPDRVKRWQSRLLDLSLINRLLNFRETGRTLQLQSSNLAAIENLLAAEDDLSIYPKSDSTQADPAAVTEFLTKELEAHRIHSAQPPAETQKRLLELFRTAKATIDETGANPLYLALGMLKWFEADAAETPRRAPLILLPVTLIRTTSGAGYRYDLRLSDEPLRPNVTLLEKLRIDFNLATNDLAHLPEDESGLDVDLILRNFRAAIKNMPRWEVEESAFLGLFSFNKFLMWRDLQENMKSLLQNRLVRHLVDRTPGQFDPAPLPRPDDLDNTVAPADLLCTRDADSTQLAAIRAAAENRTFVLEGPPGTGKSQTITNIIADSIARGKRVLFVAEKMAALSVVRSRLEKDGLAPFCLELHSAKASKKEVLAQLEASLNTIPPAAPRDWAASADELSRSRNHLNTYVRAMHERRATDETLHQVLGRLIHLGEGPRTTLPAETVHTATAASLRAWREQIDLLTKRLDAVDPVHQHPLRGIARAQWSFGLPEQAKEALAAATTSLSRLEATLTSLRTSLQTSDFDSLSPASLDALISIATLLQQPHLPDRRLVLGPDAPALIADIQSLCDQGEQRDAKRAVLLTTYREEFLSLDHLPHLDAATHALKSPAILRFFKSHFLRKKLRPYCTAAVPSLANLRADLESAREIKQLSERLAARTDLAELLGRTWNHGRADWSALRALLTWSTNLRTALDTISRDPSPNSSNPALAQSLADSILDPTRRDAARPAAAAVLSAWSQWSTSWSALCTLLITSTDAALASHSSTHPNSGLIPALRAVLPRWASGLSDLNDWCAWRQARDVASAQGLTHLLELVERGDIASADLSTTFERSFAETWFNNLANSIDAIRDFNGPSHSKSIAHFRALDQHLINATRHFIGAKLAEGMPNNTTQTSAASELGILRRELQKKRRHLPTRRLIEQLPNLLSRLKPCFLMSPLSIAQYLDAALPPFDLVVFDEASQIPAWDAIGAIARGTEVIVVGDSKQLPPTAFFSTVDDGDDVPAEDQAVEELESILKECNASSIPAMWLGWHYRSRHESLIAFSNHFYYENRLHTFPSPLDRSPDLGVTFRHVEDGLYDKGNTRTNRIEATRVVDEVIRLLTASSTPDSIGIVTFNQSQQKLIEDLLDQKRRENPAIERFFTSESPEPVFIKNLENVQGDERDTILFSVGFGMDQFGKVSMNFGPLNQDGGERRLNVAVTRARKRLIVFSSLRPDQIDLRRTQSVGVRHFKTFLDYADRGPRAIAQATAHTPTNTATTAFDAGLENSVHRALTAKGHTVDTQVGCGGYRIDLAVRDPKNPGRFLLGIECDGLAYHSAKTARDRDRLRQSVLENLGWTIERVWSTDWRLNPDKCLRALEAAIERAASPRAVLPLSSAEARPATLKSAPAPHAAPPPSISPPPPRAVLPLSSAEARSPQQPFYRAATPPRGISTADIHDPAHAQRCADALRAIVDAEGPIVEDLAIRRLAQWLGGQRVTERFRSRVVSILAHHHTIASIEGDILWPHDPARTNPRTFSGFRIPDPSSTTDDDWRDLEHVPLFERVNAVTHVLSQQFGLPRQDLQREVAALFGTQRLTTRAKDLLDHAINAAIAHGKATDQNGQIATPR